MTTTKMVVLRYDVTVIDSGRHEIDGRRAELEIHYGSVAVFAVLRPSRGRALTWQVGHVARGEDVLCVSGPNTGWRFQIHQSFGNVTALPSPAMTDEKVSKRGRRGEGRPRLGAGETARVTVLATPEQVARWDAAAEREGQDRSEWIRDVLDEAAG